MPTCTLNSIWMVLKSQNRIWALNNQGLVSVVYLLILLIDFIWVVEGKITQP